MCRCHLDHGFVGETPTLCPTVLSFLISAELEAKYDSRYEEKVKRKVEADLANRRKLLLEQCKRKLEEGEQLESLLE